MWRGMCGSGSSIPLTHIGAPGMGWHAWLAGGQHKAGAGGKGGVRGERGRGGWAAAAEGQMHSVPKGRCAISHPQLHSIRADGVLLTKKKHHHYNYRNTRCVTTPVYDKVGYHCKTKNIAIVSNCPDITILNFILILFNFCK